MGREDVFSFILIKVGFVLSTKFCPFSCYDQKWSVEVPSTSNRLGEPAVIVLKYFNLVFSSFHVSTKMILLCCRDHDVHC